MSATASPYYVYYRTSRSKGFREFKTREAQRNFITRAPLTWAITAYN